MKENALKVVKLLCADWFFIEDCGTVKVFDDDRDAAKYFGGLLEETKLEPGEYFFAWVPRDVDDENVVRKIFGNFDIELDYILPEERGNYYLAQIASV